VWRHYWDRQKVEQLEHQEWMRRGKLEDEKFIVGCVPESKVLVDVGCGSARFYPHLKADWYVGCDFSLEMLKLAKKKGSLDLVRCDAEHLPFKEGLDSILCVDVLRHLPTLKGYNIIKEMLRVASNVVFTIMKSEEKRVYGDKHERIPSHVANHGFTLNEIKPLLGSRRYRVAFIPPQPPYKEWNRLILVVSPEVNIT